MLQTADKLTVEKCKDAGLALVLLCLIGYHFWHLPVLIAASILLLLLAMTWPRGFQPFARVWFGASAALGTVVSKAVLTGMFFGLVLPMGLMRRTLGKDPMQRRCWKKGKGSVFRVRNHRLVAEDLGHPY